MPVDLRRLGDWDINEFLGTIDLSSLNLGGKRPKLIKRIKELQPDASQRAIARAVGVGVGTVNRDLRGSPYCHPGGQGLTNLMSMFEDDTYAILMALAGETPDPGEGRE